mgnify:CR=1 FL=1
MHYSAAVVARGLPPAVASGTLPDLMLYDIVALVAGLALVAKGGDLFVDASITIAKVLRVPRIVVGGTLVSLATTTPELVVSVTASVMGDSGIAVGNAVGSCIANIGLIIGAVALIAPVTVDLADFRRSARWMAVPGLFVMAFSSDRAIGQSAGAFLLLFTAVYLYGDYRSIRARQADAIDRGEPAGEGLGPAAGWFLAGALLVIVGSRLLVTSGIEIASALGVPSVIIGLSIVAIGTSLPELVTGISAARRGAADLSIGNIVGANLLNLGLIIGMSSAIRPLDLSAFTQWYSYPWLAVFFAAMILMLGRRGTLTRPGGTLLLGLYAVYMAGLVLAPAYLGN